jgi:ribosomal protein L4
MAQKAKVTMHVTKNIRQSGTASSLSDSYNTNELPVLRNAVKNDKIAIDNFTVASEHSYHLTKSLTSSFKIVHYIAHSYCCNIFCIL